jgi:hypothetical protein
MNKKFAIGLATLALSIASTQTAQAASFTLSFAANNFAALNGSTPPASSIAGNIGYDAATINSPITSLNSIALTIAGYSYTLGEVDFANSFSSSSIGGTITGLGGLAAGTNDFSLGWDRTTLLPTGVLYVTTNTSSFYDSRTFTSFSITPAATISVPEPLTIIGSLIGGTAALQMRKKLAASKG